MAVPSVSNPKHHSNTALEMLRVSSYNAQWFRMPPTPYYQISPFCSFFLLHFQAVASFGGLGGFLHSRQCKAISGCETTRPVPKIHPEKSKLILKRELVTLGLSSM